MKSRKLKYIRIKNKRKSIKIFTGTHSWYVYKKDCLIYMTNTKNNDNLIRIWFVNNKLSYSPHRNQKARLKIRSSTYAKDIARGNW